MSAAVGPAPVAPESPTSVLDALEASLTNGWNDVVGGANARLLEDIGEVNIFSFEDEHDPVDTFLDDPYPDPSEPLATQPMWVECRTRIVHGHGSEPFRTGVLFEHSNWSGERGTDTWPWPLLSAKFVLAVLGSDGVWVPAICPARVITDVTHLSEVQDLIDELPLAEVERIRFGLPRAATATNEQLLQMSTNMLDLGGKFVHGIPTSLIQAYRTNLPRYSPAVEWGFEGLRFALATTLIERWSPSDKAAEPPLLSFDELFQNITSFGPFVARRLMAAVSQAQPGARPGRRTEALPEPFARGRKAIRIGDRQWPGPRLT